MRSILLSFFVMILLCTTAVHADPIVTESTTTSNVTTKGETETTVNSPPPSAISPSINNSNSDVCTIAFSGAVQTQILGISGGSAIRDMNCERLKNAKVLYDMGMKVAAVSVMCQDKRIFASMMNAGTPCPFDGLVGSPAKEAWNNNPHLIPGAKTGKNKEWSDEDKNTAKGAAGVGGLLALLLLLI